MLRSLENGQLVLLSGAWTIEIHRGASVLIGIVQDADTTVYRRGHTDVFESPWSLVPCQAVFRVDAVSHQSLRRKKGEASASAQLDQVLHPLPIIVVRLQAGSFNSVNFCDPPRGILTLDEDVIISKNTRPDGDLGGAVWLVIQGGGQRWKLSSEAPGEIARWEEVCIYYNLHYCCTWYGCVGV